MPVKAKSKSAVNITKGNVDAYLQKKKQINAAADLELDNFWNQGIKKAGSASRKYLQEEKKMAQEGRLMIQAKKNADKEAKE